MEAENVMQNAMQNDVQPALQPEIALHPAYEPTQAMIKAMTGATVFIASLIESFPTPVEQIAFMRLMETAMGINCGHIEAELMKRFTDQELATQKAAELPINEKAARKAANTRLYRIDQEALRYAKHFKFGGKNQDNGTTA